MNLKETLQLMAADFQLDADALIAYAKEDPHPRMGWDNNAGLAPLGAIWSVEGQVLYALTRLLKPALIVEVGSHTGASTTHLAAALKQNRAGGKVVSIDRAGGGAMLPITLKKFVEFIVGDGADVIRHMAKDTAIDLLFEDAGHDRAGTAGIVKAAWARMSDGAFGISHDAAHFMVGADIRGGLSDAGVNAITYLTEPSDCGLGVWRK